MLLEFKRITFNNFLSFGSKPTTIEFKKGLNLVTGLNGVGKSAAILDSLSFCLYGKPYRDITIKELINRKNRKGMTTEVEFSIDGRDTYLIKRSLKPDELMIYKNNSTIDLLSSKKLNQDEIDKILGIDYKLFKQVISLSINFNKPFLSLAMQEKRDIIEQIFGIVVFGQMLKILKKKNCDEKIQYDLSKNTSRLLEENLKSLRKRLSEVTIANQNFEKDRTKDLLLVDERIRSYELEKQGIQNKIDDIEIPDTKDDESKLTGLSVALENIIKSISRAEYDIKLANNKINFINKNEDVCSECGSLITEEHKKSELEKHQNIVKSSATDIDNFSASKKEISVEIRNIQSNIKSAHDKKQEQNNLKEKIVYIDREIIQQYKRKEEIQNRKIEINVEAVQEEFNKKVNEYKLVARTEEDLNKKLKINQVNAGILSESGIKAFFFKKLIPVLNGKINEYIRLFEIPIMFSFDELMQEKILALDSQQREISYYSFSEGEKKRLDLAILFAFINITKMIANWNCNVMIIDELLDSSVDSNGLDKFLISIKKMIEDSENNLSVYIISHKINSSEFDEAFDRKIEVRKGINNFSNMVFN